jgi:hypothetical protein
MEPTTVWGTIVSSCFCTHGTNNGLRYKSSLSCTQGTSDGLKYTCTFTFLYAWNQRWFEVQFTNSQYYDIAYKFCALSLETLHLKQTKSVALVHEQTISTAACRQSFLWIPTAIFSIFLDRKETLHLKQIRVPTYSSSLPTMHSLLLVDSISLKTMLLCLQYAIARELQILYPVPYITFGLHQQDTTVDCHFITLFALHGTEGHPPSRVELCAPTITLQCHHHVHYTIVTIIQIHPHLTHRSSGRRNICWVQPPSPRILQDTPRYRSYWTVYTASGGVHSYVHEVWSNCDNDLHGCSVGWSTETDQVPSTCITYA